MAEVMPAGFHRGERVKLTERAAQSAIQGYCNFHRKHPPDWANRRGIVRHTPARASGCVLIVWDGCKGHDSWPKAAIEKIEPAC